MKAFYTTNYTNYLFRFIFAMAICLPVLSMSAAAAPTNDNFANATSLGNTTSANVPGTNVGATKEAGELTHTFNRGGASVWYRWTPLNDTVAKINTTATFNTLLAVYSGTNLSNLKLVTANDDDNGLLGTSTVYFGAKANTTFYIVVDGKYFENSGVVAENTFTLNLSLDDSMPNDFFVNAATLRNDQPVNSTTLTNAGASKEPDEPNHAGNEGGKSVWFKWTAPAGQPKSYTCSIDTTAVANPGSFASPVIAIYTGSSLNSLTPVVQNSAGNFPRLIFQGQPNTTYYIAVDGYDNGSGASVGNTMLSIGITKSKKIADFDRDGRADITVYRPSNGNFYSLDSITGAYRQFKWGKDGDRPLLNDLNNDGLTDYGVYRSSDQKWYLMSTDDYSYSIFKWGLPTDIPLHLYFYHHSSNSYFNTFSTFRPTDGTWWIPLSLDTWKTFQFGLNGDIPMTFDHDGDGTDELVVFRPSNGTWYFAAQADGQYIGEYNFGLAGDIPTAADFDGDGKNDIAIFRPSTGDWWFLDRETGAQTAIHFGTNGDKPQPADYDGDGKADLAVFRNGMWWIRQSNQSQSVKIVNFGLSTDIPITAPVSQ